MALDLGKVATPSRSEKPPKLSSLAVTAPSPAIRKRPLSAPCTVVIYLISKGTAEKWWDEAPKGYNLWQIQFEHDAADSITHNLYDKFAAFLQANDNTPNSIGELRKGLIKLVVTSDRDPDELGSVRWRAALYVAGREEVEELYNALMLLDEFWAWANRDREDPVAIELYSSSADLNHVRQDLTYSDTKIYPDKELPFNFWECAPVAGSRWLTVTAQGEAEIKCSFIFAGNTWPFKTTFDEHMAGGYYHESGGKNLYYRVLRDQGPEDKDKVATLIQDLRSCLRVVIDGPVSAAWVAMLGSQPLAYFA